MDHFIEEGEGMSFLFVVFRQWWNQWLGAAYYGPVGAPDINPSKARKVAQPEN